MKYLINGRDLILGTCYYPEHWDKSLWEEDLHRMQDSGISVIRIAEFAWSKFEPTEGCFNFSFFDSFLETVSKTAMKVIFCTPTATPPAWLTQKYPEVLNVRMDGVSYRHGARRHYNYNSPVYQHFCKTIVEKTAAHYASHPCIIGWQIDNELNCETAEFYSESDSDAFREFLREKYGTVEKLNDAWGTVFWNQTYTSFDEVYVPQTTISNSTNPHRVLYYTRFISQSARRFAKMQADILRKYIKADDFITTNGLFANLDYHRLTAESLDFITYDSYPNFAYCLDDYEENDPLKDRKWSRNLTETRAVSPVFGIMEQQSGANGWNTRMEAPTPKPGQLTLWTMQSIAHGADFVSYFRWRTCTVGTEIYWHGILDYSGRENRRLREVCAVSEKISHMQEIAGSLYEARVGVLKEYDNIWDSQLDKWHQRVDQMSQKSLFTAAQLTHTPLDFLYFTDQLTPKQLRKYEVLFYPHAVILTPERVKLLEDYVASGGTLVMGCRTGYKDMNGKCVMTPLPGLAARLTGTDIPEYSFIAPDEGPVQVDWDGALMEAAVFNDMLAPASDSAKVLGTYCSGIFAGQPALICNRFGAGTAYYFGGAFALDSAKAFLNRLGVADPWKSVIEIPECCEIAVRSSSSARYLFVLNYSARPVAIHLKQSVQNMLTGEKETGTMELEKYGAAVYRMSL